MNIKQRVVGAVVLVSMAIIFIPMLLETPHEDTLQPVLPVPATPELPRFSIEEARPPKPLSDIRPLERHVDSPEALPAAANEEIEETEFDAGAVPEKAVPAAVMPYKLVEKADIPDETSGQSGVAVVAPDKPDGKPDVKPEGKPVATDYSLDGSNRPTGWALQIGTFKNRASATSIRDELMAKKTGGYVQDFKAADGQVLTRVFAGPFLERNHADKAKSEIDKHYKVNSLVVQYRPSR
jgi:DedD protein